MSADIESKIFGTFEFINTMFSCPQRENFWVILLSILLGQAKSMNEIAECLGKWKDQSTLFNFVGCWAFNCKDFRRSSKEIERKN